jgi:putative Mn2+ efflux pump MntP
MGDIKETIKKAFDKKTALVIAGGVLGALGVLMISNALQDAPNLLYPAQAVTPPPVTAPAEGGE